jgi:hypothetical protein
MTSRTLHARRDVAALVALSLSVAGLMGLASCGDASEPAGAPSASASASVGLPAPVIVEPGQAEASATVGETIVFSQPDPARTQVSTDRPDVLELTQGSDDGSAQFNPAAKAVAPGVAVVTIEAADGSTSTVTVTVS